MLKTQLRFVREYLIGRKSVKVKVKKLKKEAVIPSYSRAGDAGLDLVAISKTFNEDKGYAEYGTGLAVEIPKGYVGLIFPRSSISNYNVQLTNCVGVIDENFRGEIRFRFKPDYIAVADMMGEPLPSPVEVYQPGDRIGQLLIIKNNKIQLEEVEELSETNRGKGGFGSSGK